MLTWAGSLQAPAVFAFDPSAKVLVVSEVPFAVYFHSPVSDSAGPAGADLVGGLADVHRAVVADAAAQVVERAGPAVGRIGSRTLILVAVAGSQVDADASLGIVEDAGAGHGGERSPLRHGAALELLEGEAAVPIVDQPAR